MPRTRIGLLAALTSLALGGYRCRALARCRAPNIPGARVTLGRPVARAPSAAARWAALGCWARAQARSNREREALEAWDPAAPERLDTEAWRQQTIAADPDGSLRQARRLAAHASALARTSGEQYAAASLQVQLAYEAGDRAGAERAARRLLILAPRSISTRQALRRWAGQ